MGWSRRFPGRALFLVFSLAMALSPRLAEAQAQNPVLVVAGRTPAPSIPMTDLSAGAAVTNLGSTFLERLGDQASGGIGRASRSNPGGGGASGATEAPGFRAWGGGYGISTRTGPQ